MTPTGLGKEERFRLAFECAGLSLALVDLDGNIFEANQACADFFGCTAEELKRLNLVDIWIPEDRDEAMADYKRAASGNAVNTTHERRYLNKRGEIIFAEVVRGLVRSRTGEPRFFVSSLRDITARKRLQALLEERASTDPLTGVMNRNGIEERVRSELLRSDRYGDKLSLVLIDLDHFKAVNDAYGHLAGDRILQGFCALARSCLRSTDSLGRVGGEEFVALLPETGLSGARLFAERLRTTLEAFQFDRGIRITASMGIAGHREGEELSSLMERADLAMYQAKKSGRNRVVLDSEDVERAEPERAQSAHITLQWQPSYLCGQPLIDAEHQELFSLINSMMIAMPEKGADEYVLPWVGKLIETIQMHFANEELVLRASGYPDAESHAQIHCRLVQRACELQRHFELQQDCTGELVGFLIHDVVARHMLRDDRKFFPWLKAKQLHQAA